MAASFLQGTVQPLLAEHSVAAAVRTRVVCVVRCFPPQIHRHPSSSTDESHTHAASRDHAIHAQSKRLIPFTPTIHR